MTDFREDDGHWADPWRWHEKQPLEDYIDYVLERSRALMAEVSAETDKGNDPIKPAADHKQDDVE